jgi:hypothetical protein
VLFNDIECFVQTLHFFTEVAEDAPTSVLGHVSDYHIQIENNYRIFLITTADDMDRN